MKNVTPKQARETMGFNQTQMARAMGVSRGLWLKWERGEQRLTAGPARLIETLVWLKDIGIIDLFLKQFPG